MKHFIKCAYSFTSDPERDVNKRFSIVTFDKQYRYPINDYQRAQSHFLERGDSRPSKLDIS